MLRVSRVLPWYTGLCVVSLFIGIKYQVGVVLRPFDALIGLGTLLLIGRASVSGRIESIRKNPAYALFVVTYGYRCLSGFFMSGGGTAIKETIQIIEFIVLIHLVASATRDEERRRQFLRVLLVGFGVLSIFTAVWHLAHGSYANYKHLGDTKYTFALFGLFASISYVRSQTSLRFWVLGLALLLTVLSGERKGWIALIGAGMVMYFVYQGRSARRLLSSIFRLRLLLGGGVAIALLLIAAIQFEYVRGQFRSLYDLYIIASNLSLQIDLSTFETSGSNLARLYVLLFTVRTALDHPVFGVGTGRWHDALAKVSESASSNYQIGAHSEYQRLTVENGLLGLGLYLISWFVTLRMAVRLFLQVPVHLRTSVLAVIGLAVFGASINLFLGGGALNILFMALPVGLLVGLKNNFSTVLRKGQVSTAPSES